jgi:nucleotide-binding universal stress UspA family protein
MPGKLLVPVDLSGEKPAALRFAVRLARASSAQILLLHVIDYVPTMLPVEMPAGYLVPQLDVVRAAAEKKLRRIAAKAGYGKLRTLIEVGGAATAIVDVARRAKVEQIVMGSHSQRAVARFVLGSVADRVAHTAACPVTIVRAPKR